MQEKNTLSKKFATRLGFWHYLLIFVAIALTTSIVLGIITPEDKTVALKNEVVISNYDKSKSTFKKISFSGQEITLPETFAIYRATQSNSSAETLANQIINASNLVLHQNIVNYWVGENSELVKSDSEQNYTFAETMASQDNDVKIIKSHAVQTCLNFYNKYNTGLKLAVQENSIGYFDDDEEQSEVAEQDAYVLQIPLTYELDGYPVFYENEQDYPFFCKIDNTYNLRRVVFKDFFYNFETIDQMPPISIDQAINNIKNGVASIVGAESQVTYIIDLNKINEADLYSVKIDYRYDSVLKIVYPFYKFNGKLTTDEDNNIQAIIITPAVATAIEK